MFNIVPLVLVTLTAFFTPALGHAGVLALALEQAVEVAANMPETQSVDRARNLAVIGLRQIAEVQVRSNEPFALDQGDILAWAAFVETIAPALMGARPDARLRRDPQMRRVGDRLRADARQTYRILDRMLTPAQREALRTSYPSLVRALRDHRPRLRGTMIRKHLQRHDHDVAPTIAVFGTWTVVREILRWGSERYLGWPRAASDRAVRDRLVVQTLMSLAEFLNLPPETGFCEVLLVEAH